MTHDIADVDTDVDTALWIPYSSPILELFDGVTVGTVDVTPEIAQAWLDRNKHNRKLSPESVDRYSRNITNGQWPFTGDPIRFANTGELLDGQHRCTAIVETGVTLPLLVVAGLLTDTQSYMDAGRRRNAGDSLAIKEIPNYVAVASLVRLALLWNPNGLWEPGRGTRLFGKYYQVSVPEVLDFAERYPVVHEAARRGVALAKLVPGSRASVVGAAYLRATLLPEGVFDTAEWFHRLETGAGLELGDPVLALRNGMMRTRAEGLTNPQVQQLWKVIRAWNASRDGQEMDRINMTTRALTNDNFPDMQ